MSVTAQQVSSSNSTKSFLTALVANGGLLVVEIAAFVILKSRLGRIYSPRTYLPPPDKRAVELPGSWWRWLPALLVESPSEIIHKNGLDAYMVLRFLKMLVWIFFVFTISTFLVIVPVDIVGVQSSVSDSLERVTWSNIVNPADQKRFSAHIIMIYLLTFFVLYMIRREMLHFVDIRHKFLISKSHSRLAQARTVLITNVPDELANEHDLRLFASFVPGGIDRVWIYRDTKVLNKLFGRRLSACNKLEAAEAKVLKHATDAWRIKELAHRKMQKKMKRDEERGDAPLEFPTAPLRELLDELVPLDVRPKHRIGFLGLFGRKVETIPWCTEEISKLNREIGEVRQNIVKGKWMETNPKDIVWDNLDDGALEMSWRYVTSWIATIGLIIVWGFPVTFIGTLSRIDTVCSKAHWLAWVCTAPNPIPGIIQGILPPVLLAILFALLPIVLRGLAWYECIPRYSLISVSVYRRFFLFLIIHGFLVVTLSSNITQITQGLAGAGAALAQLVPLVLHYIRKWFLGRTPRQAFDVTFKMPSADFGLILPRLSLLATIGFAYSVINPVINLFAFLSYVMFYLAFKFLLTQVYDQPDESETGGMYFPMAVSNLFVGLYIEQLCLACLFFLKASVSPVSSVVEGVLMLFLVVITAAAQIMTNRSFGPITEFLPMSLATKKMAKRYEKHQKKQGIPMTPDVEEGFDLFKRDALRSVRRRMKHLPRQFDPQQEEQDTRQKEAEQEAVADLKNGDAPEMYRQSSSASRGSKKSKASSKKSDRPTFDPPAAAGVDLSDEDVSSDEEEEQDDHAFDHPSTYVEQPWIWMPKDRLGLSQLLVDDLHSVGVDASDLGAVMDEKGIVEVTRNPPDEEWGGGHDS
ncbi:DUF221 family protein [Mycena capillaripes]|nr:DUF221 family protein [Mycena capillaripes]